MVDIGPVSMGPAYGDKRVYASTIALICRPAPERASAMAAKRSRRRVISQSPSPGALRANNYRFGVTLGQ